MNLPKFRKTCCSTSSLLRCQMMEVFRIHQPFSDAKVDVGNGRCNLHRVFDAGKLGLLSVANSALDFYSGTLQLCQDVSTIVRKKLPTHCTRKNSTSYSYPKLNYWFMALGKPVILGELRSQDPRRLLLDAFGFQVILIQKPRTKRSSKGCSNPEKNSFECCLMLV